MTHPVCGQRKPFLARGHVSSCGHVLGASAGFFAFRNIPAVVWGFRRSVGRGFCRRVFQGEPDIFLKEKTPPLVVSYSPGGTTPRDPGPDAACTGRVQSAAHAPRTVPCVGSI